MRSIPPLADSEKTKEFQALPSGGEPATTSSDAFTTEIKETQEDGLLHEVKNK